MKKTKYLLFFLLLISCTYNPKEIRVSASEEEPWTFIIEGNNGNENTLLLYLIKNESSINMFYGIKENNLNNRRTGYQISIRNDNTKIIDGKIEVKGIVPNFDDYVNNIDKTLDISDIYLIIPNKNVNKAKIISLIREKVIYEHIMNEEFNRQKEILKKYIISTAIYVNTNEFIYKYMNNPIKQTEYYDGKFIVFNGIINSIGNTSLIQNTYNVIVNNRIEIDLTKNDILKIEIGKQAKIFGSLNEDSISMYEMTGNIKISNAFLE